MAQLKKPQSQSSPADMLPVPAAVQADHYYLRLQDHQQAYLNWLEDAGQHQQEIDRYQFRKIR